VHKACLRVKTSVLQCYDDDGVNSSSNVRADPVDMDKYLLY
jgi:hypothetical protein